MKRRNVILLTVFLSLIVTGMLLFLIRVAVPFCYLTGVIPDRYSRTYNIRTRAGDTFYVKVKRLSWSGEYGHQLYFNQIATSHFIFTLGSESDKDDDRVMVDTIYTDNHIVCYECKLLKRPNDVFIVVSDTTTTQPERVIFYTQDYAANDLDSDGTDYTEWSIIKPCAVTLFNTKKWMWFMIFSKYLIATDPDMVKGTVTRYAAGRFTGEELSLNKHDMQTREKVIAHAKRLKQTYIDSATSQ